MKAWFILHVYWTRSLLPLEMCGHVASQNIHRNVGILLNLPTSVVAAVFRLATGAFLATWEANEEMHVAFSLTKSTRCCPCNPSPLQKGLALAWIVVTAGGAVGTAEVGAVLGGTPSWLCAMGVPLPRRCPACAEVLQRQRPKESGRGCREIGKATEVERDGEECDWNDGNVRDVEQWKKRESEQDWEGHEGFDWVDAVSW